MRNVSTEIYLDRNGNRHNIKTNGKKKHIFDGCDVVIYKYVYLVIK